MSKGGGRRGKVLGHLGKWLTLKGREVRRKGREGKGSSVGREERCGHLRGKDTELQSGLSGRQWSLDSDRAFSSLPVPLPHIKYYFPCLALQPSEPLSVVRPSMSNDANSDVQVTGKCRGCTRNNFIQEGPHCLSRVLFNLQLPNKDNVTFAFCFRALQ